MQSPPTVEKVKGEGDLPKYTLFHRYHLEKDEINVPIALSAFRDNNIPSGERVQGSFNKSACEIVWFLDLYRPAVIHTVLCVCVCVCVVCVLCVCCVSDVCVMCARVCVWCVCCVCVLCV